MSRPWFIVDAHEDIACHCQEIQRDLVDPGAAECMLTLPWLMQAGVRLICATLFVPHEYSTEVRQQKLAEQYGLYERWLGEYPQALRLIRSKSDLASLLALPPIGQGPLSGHPVGMIILMEGCDLLDTPADLELWHRRGLRMASLTWNGVNRYASGCFGDYKGLRGEARELLAEFQRLGVTLDLSHLTDAGVDDVLSVYDGPLVATHSNSRTLCQHERNLTDDQIKEIGRRGGMIGLNLLANFIVSGWSREAPLPTLEQTLEHPLRMAGLTGWEHLGLGTDLDGGLTPANTPEGIDTILDISSLFEGLLAQGVAPEHVEGFAGGNWLRYFERSLPD